MAAPQPPVLRMKSDVPLLCLKCKLAPPQYSAQPCGCIVLCKACAMKLATGGKCKVGMCVRGFDTHRRHNPCHATIHLLLPRIGIAGVRMHVF
jgi:hypothetical protein